METYGKLLNITVPFFMFFFFVEKFVEWRRGLHVIRGLDSVASFSSGITNVVKDVLGIGVTLMSYHWLVNNISVFQVGSSVFTYIIAFIVIDFLLKGSKEFVPKNKNLRQVFIHILFVNGMMNPVV